MVTTMENVEDPGVALLDTCDVADLFQRCDPEGYATARRRFYREVSINPFKKHPEAMLRLIEWSFCDWFAFECAVEGSSIGDDGDGGGPRFRVCPEGKTGKSPYLVTAERLYDCDGIDAAQLSDMRDVDATNFASIFWIDDANAVKSLMRVEDVMNGGRYELHCPSDSAKYDGAHGGTIVNRIAKVRGVWRPCAIAIYESRRPDTRQTRDMLVESFGPCGYQPDFPGLLRFFYGRAKDTGLDWEDLVALMYE